MDLPIVFEEEAHFILMSIPKPLREGLVIFKRGQLRRVLHVVELADAGKRSRKETEQTPHPLVISGAGITGESRHIGTGSNRGRRNRSE